jgi:hypothetical protein
MAKVKSSKKKIRSSTVRRVARCTSGVSTRYPKAPTLRRAVVVYSKEGPLAKKRVLRVQKRHSLPVPSQAHRGELCSYVVDLRRRSKGYPRLSVKKMGYPSVRRVALPTCDAGKLCGRTCIKKLDVCGGKPKKVVAKRITSPHCKKGVLCGMTCLPRGRCKRALLPRPMLPAMP